MRSQQSNTQVISGTIRNLSVENITAEVFFRQGDREGMAATGALAAAMGLSGMAAGMVAMSAEETREPVTKVSFDLDGKAVEALLWNWPFKEGDQVEVVAELSADKFIGFAVLDSKEKIIVLYPHLSAGNLAHWKGVIKISFITGVVATLIMCALLGFGNFYIYGWNINGFIEIIGIGVLAGVCVFSWLGYRIGRRFTLFTKMAERIFTALGWNNVSNINLRKITKSKRKPSDPPAMGDSYFRY